METKEQRKEEFLKDLKELLKKHDADIQLEEINYRAYMGGDWVMTAYLDSEYDAEYDCLKEYTEINLGNYIDGKD